MHTHTHTHNWAFPFSDQSFSPSSGPVIPNTQQPKGTKKKTQNPSLPLRNKTYPGGGTGKRPKTRRGGLDPRCHNASFAPPPSSSLGLSRWPHRETGGKTAPDGGASLTGRDQSDAHGEVTYIHPMHTLRTLCTLRTYVQCVCRQRLSISLPIPFLRGPEPRPSSPTRYRQARLLLLLRAASCRRQDTRRRRPALQPAPPRRWRRRSGRL